MAAVSDSTCVQCGGTGWKIVERDGLSGAERCSCFGERRAARLGEAAQIPPNYKNATFESFLFHRPEKQQEALLQGAYQAAYTYTEKFPLDLKKPGLLFVGPTGTGKTHLAVAVMRRLMQQGHECFFIGYQDLLEKLKSSYDPSYGSARRESFERALECEVLVLDDLGAYRVSDWVLDTVTYLMTERCNQRRPVIATTNLLEHPAGPVRKMPGGETDTRYMLSERIGERARSRLMEMCLTVRLHGIADYREAKTISR